MFNLPLLKSYVESHPWLWTIAWRLLHSNTIFLPHDPTYYALNHLVKNNTGLIIDIGANQGISALSFLMLCPNHKILSIEPVKAHEKYLSKIKSKNTNFDYEIIGLSDEVGQVTFYTPEIGNIQLHTFTSIDRGHVNTALEKTYSHKVLDRIKISENTCEVKRLDDLGLSPEVIKIDAEGHELNILQGAVNTLDNASPKLIFEACHKDISPIRDLLESKGYILLKYDHLKDEFTKVNTNTNGVEYISGHRNLIAIKKHDLDGLPLKN